MPFTIVLNVVKDDTQNVEAPLGYIDKQVAFIAGKPEGRHNLLLIRPQLI